MFRLDSDRLWYQLMTDTLLTFILDFITMLGFRIVLDILIPRHSDIHRGLFPLKRNPLEPTNIVTTTEIIVTSWFWRKRGYPLLQREQHRNHPKKAQPPQLLYHTCEKGGEKSMEEFIVLRW